MALLFCDSFDHYATAEFPRKYYTVDTSYNTIQSTVKRTGAQAWRGGLTTYPARIHIPRSNPVIVGAAVNITGGVNGDLFRFMGGNDTVVNIKHFRGGGVGATVYGMSPDNVCWSNSGVMRPNIWHYLEAKVYLHDSAGYITIKLDGATVASVSNIDTLYNYTVADGYMDNIRIESAFISGYTYYDDLYICDTTGSYCNDFLGDVRVDVLAPNAVGNSSGFTRLSGSNNYEMVDDTTDCDDDTTYNQANSVVTDTYNFPALPHTATSIKAVQIVTQAERTALAARQLAHVVRRSSTDYASADLLLENATYKTQRSIWHTDPSTSAAWTQSNLEAAEFGMKIAR